MKIRKAISVVMAAALCIISLAAPVSAQTAANAFDPEALNLVARDFVTDVSAANSASEDEGQILLTPKSFTPDRGVRAINRISGVQAWAVTYDGDEVGEVSMWIEFAYTGSDAYVADYDSPEAERYNNDYQIDLGSVTTRRGSTASAKFKVTVASNWSIVTRSFTPTIMCTRNGDITAY